MFFEKRNIIKDWYNKKTMISRVHKKNNGEQLSAITVTIVFSPDTSVTFINNI